MHSQLNLSQELQEGQRIVEDMRVKRSYRLVAEPTRRWGRRLLLVAAAASAIAVGSCFYKGSHEPPSLETPALVQGEYATPYVQE